MPPILNAQSVTKQFGATPLFRDISLTVDDGARIGLIGPNGAGKSTLLAILAGQVEPDTGELAVRKRARAAYVPQDSRFAAGLTIRQVLETALAAAHVNESEREGQAARAYRPRWICGPRRRSSLAFWRVAQAAGDHRGAGQRPRM